MMEFESAPPSIIKSIRQREFLNIWLRLYARHERPPKFEEYRPERLSDEAEDLVYLIAEGTTDMPRFYIERDGDRLTTAFGAAGRGRDLEEYMGAKLAPLVVPIYEECLRRALPAFTISELNDLHGRKVDYERLILPFSDDGITVNRFIASVKAISDDGGFEIRNLMRSNTMPPNYKLRAMIDRDLFHRSPGRFTPGDTIEFI